MPQNPNLFLSVGKLIKDEYGREIGKVASFAMTPSGKFDAVFIEQGDGKFQKYSIEYLKIDGDFVTLSSRMKSAANLFCDQIPLLWRKDQALRELVEKKKISPEIYRELHISFDGALKQLKSEAQVLLEELDAELDRCSEETRELNCALVHLELEHEIGKVEGDNYENAFAMIQESIKRVNVEKNDIEGTKSKLSNILLGEAQETLNAEKTATKEGTSKGFAPVSSGSELPEPPVVVYVKEIGKAGI